MCRYPWQSLKWDIIPIFCFICLIISPPVCRKTSYQPFSECPEKTYFGVIIHQGLISKSMQQQQSWLFQTNRIKIMIVNSEMKLKLKTMVLLMKKCPLHVTSTTGNTTNYTIYNLMSICDLSLQTFCKSILVLDESFPVPFFYNLKHINLYFFQKSMKTSIPPPRVSHIFKKWSLVFWAVR